MVLRLQYELPTKNVISTIERIEWLPNIDVAVISDDGKTVIKEQQSLAVLLLVASIAVKTVFTYIHYGFSKCYVNNLYFE